MTDKLSLDEVLDIRQFLSNEIEMIRFGESGRTPTEDEEEIIIITKEIKRVESLYLNEIKTEETINLLQPVFGVIEDYHKLLYTVFETPHKDPAPLIKKFQATLQRDISLQMDNLKLDLIPFLERHVIPFNDFVGAAKSSDYYKENTAKIFMISGTDAKIDAMLDRIVSIITSYESALTGAFLTMHDRKIFDSGDVINSLMTEMKVSLEKFLSIANDELIPYCDDNGFDPYQILVDLFDQIDLKQEESGFEGDLLDEGLEVDIDSLDDDFDDFDDDDEVGFGKRNRFDEEDSFDDDAGFGDDDDDFKPGKKRKGW